MARRPKKSVADNKRKFPPVYEPLHPREPKPTRIAGSHHPRVAVTSEGRGPLELLFELSCDGIVLHEFVSAGSSGNFLEANDAICRMLGYTADEIRTLTPLDILPPEELSCVPADTEVMQNEGVLVHEKTLIARDGRRIPVEISSRLFELDGRQMAVSVIRDITARRRAEQELRIKEMALACSINAIAIGDLSGRLTYVNQAFLDMWGYEHRQEVLGRSAVEFWQSADEAGTILQHLFQTGVWQGELIGRRKDGARFAANLSASVITDEAGTPVSLIASFIDITEHRRAREALTASESKFRTFVCQSLDGIVIIDKEGRIVEWSDGEEQITGIPRSEAVGRPLWEVQHRLAPDETKSPALLETARAKILNGLREGPRLRRIVEDEIRRPDGSRRIIESTIFPVRAGENILAGGISHDITEHRQIERALRESEERLWLALEGGGMGRWEWDLQTDSWFWCERARKLLGLEPFKAARAETFFDCIHPQDKDTLRALVKNALNEPGDFQVEFRVIRCDEVRGEVAWLALRGKATRDERGRPVRMLGVLFEVTQRRQMEEQLRRLNNELEAEVKAQTEELRDTVNRLQDEVVRRVLAEGKLRRHSQMLEGFFQFTITPLAFLDRYLNFVRVNDAYAKVHGRTAESFAGENYVATHPHDESREILRHVIETRQAYFAHARPFVHTERHEPRVTYWDLQVTPVLNDDGEVQFLVLNLEDVTRQQVALQELKQRTSQLQKLTLELSQAEDRERSRLAEVLHDHLQQILAAAKFHVNVLCARPRSFEEIREIGGQVNQMLREAIDESRSLSHELSPAVLYQTDLDDTFEWLARQMESKHGLVVHLEVRGRVELPSQPLRTFLYRTARELLFNVTKHSRTNEARLRLQRLRGRLCLTISDKGLGFDPKALAGTAGFGLLAIRERVELLGGYMKIRSVPGRGSTFLISIPDAEPPHTMGATVS